MGIKRKKKKSKAGITLTIRKLETLLADFLAKHEVDMTADYQPESEQWRQLLAKTMTLYVIDNMK